MRKPIFLAAVAACLLTLPAVAEAKLANAIVQRTNRFRRAHGLPPLRVSRKLSQVALRHARNMARKNRMAHVLGGRDAGQRLTRAGYRWSNYGENVAWGYKGVRKVVRSWIKSKPHRKNLLNRKVTEIGVGVAYRKGTPFYCQVFARPQ
jgi:uncharacterized protein YkwD